MGFSHGVPLGHEHYPREQKKREARRYDGEGQQYNHGEFFFYCLQYNCSLIFESNLLSILRSRSNVHAKYKRRNRLRSLQKLRD